MSRRQPVAPRRGGLNGRRTDGRGNAAPRVAARSISELLQAPGRRNQPHLHPHKIDGSLW